MRRAPTASACPAKSRGASDAAGVDAPTSICSPSPRGPGAFTGLRIGLAAMQGLAMVSNKPVVGVSALDALALARRASRRPTRRTIGAWMDAQRGEVFALDGYRRVAEASGRLIARRTTASSPAAAARLAGDVASGRAVARDRIRRRRRGAVSTGDLTRASRRAVDRSRTAGAAGARDCGDLAVASRARGLRRVRRTRSQPLYVRRPDAELERERRPQRMTHRRSSAIAIGQPTSTASWRSSRRRSTTRRPASGTRASCSVRTSATSTSCARRTCPVAGFCAFWKVLDQMHINNLAVHPELPPARPRLDICSARILAEATGLGATARPSKCGARTLPRAAAVRRRAGFAWPACGPATTRKPDRGRADSQHVQLTSRGRVVECRLRSGAHPAPDPEGRRHTMAEART